MDQFLENKLPKLTQDKINIFNFPITIIEIKNVMTNLSSYIPPNLQEPMTYCRMNIQRINTNFTQSLLENKRKKNTPNLFYMPNVILVLKYRGEWGKETKEKKDMKIQTNISH